MYMFLLCVSVGWAESTSIGNWNYILELDYKDHILGFRRFERYNLEEIMRDLMYNIYLYIHVRATAKICTRFCENCSEIYGDFARGE